MSGDRSRVLVPLHGDTIENHLYYTERTRENTVYNSIYVYSPSAIVLVRAHFCYMIV